MRTPFVESSRHDPYSGTSLAYRNLGTLVICYMHTHYLFPDFPTVRALLPVARDLLTHSLRDDAVQRAFLTSFPDFQRRAARVDGALGRQRSGLFTLCGVTAR